MDDAKVELFRFYVNLTQGMTTFRKKLLLSDTCEVEKGNKYFLERTRNR